MRCFVIPLLAVLAGCQGIQQDVSAVGKSPGMWVCAGKASVSASGQALVYGVNGNIMFDCGSGAYFGGGFPAANLPTVPSIGNPNIPSMPPLGPMPSVTIGPTQ